MFSLKNKVIVITGAVGLLGEQHVIAVAKAGGDVIMIDINQEKLDKIEKKVEKKYKIKCLGLKVDITNEDEVNKACKKGLKIFRKFDGLINNAANNPKVEKKSKNISRLENYPLNLWQSDIDVSLKGSFLCSKYFGHEISKNPSGGSIINISSDLGLIAPNQNIYKTQNTKFKDQFVKPITYSIVKHGIIGLSKYLSTYWASQNVRSNVICPGGILNNQPEEFITNVSDLIPLGRMGNKDELQGLIIYLLSDASSYMTGATISIDGGRTVW